MVEDRGRAGKVESSRVSVDGILGLPKPLSEAGPLSINASLPIATQGSIIFSTFIMFIVKGMFGFLL